jgi:hypothetical protein
MENILDLIPKNHYKKPIEELRNNKTEWRWRIYKIGNKQYLETSQLKNNERLYATEEYKWVIRNIDLQYDKYIVDEFYYYT